MKKFFLVYKEALLAYLVINLIFILITAIFDALSVLVALIVLIYYLILYVKRQNKIKERFELSILKFNIYYTISWIINSYLILGITVDILFNIIPKSDGFLGGFEYVFLFGLSTIYIIFNIIVQIINYIIRKVKNRKRHSMN